WHDSMAGYAGDKLRALRGPRPVVAVDEQLVRELADNNGIPPVVACSMQDPAEVLAQAHFPLVVGVVETEEGAVITEVATAENGELKVTPIASAEAISPPGPAGIADAVAASARSEEHTSELQSRFDLVCRLLLEKKQHPLEPRRVRLQQGRSTNNAM